MKYVFNLIAVVALVVGSIALVKPSTASAPVVGGNFVTNTETHSNGLIVKGAGTSTLQVKSSTSGRGGCIEMNMASSSVVRLNLVASTTVAGANGYVVFNYGTCQ